MQIPHDIRAEQCVLATIALKPDLAGELQSRLTRPEAFFDRKHQALYQALLNLAERGEAPDPVTVTAEVRRLGLIGNFGRNDCEKYCWDIFQRVPALRHYEEYARIVQSRWALRELANSAHEVAAATALPESTLEALALQMQQGSLAVLAMGDGQPTAHFGDVARQVLDDAIDRAEEASRLADGGVLGLPTGIPELTTLIGGLKPATLVIQGARPGQGKSTLMMQTAREVALTAPARHGRDDVGGALLISLEMRPIELVGKVLYGEANVDNHDVDLGRLNDAELLRVEKAVQDLAGLRIFIEHLADPTWAQVRGKILMGCEKFSPDVVFVDYVQKIKKPARTEAKEHVAELAKGLKALAVELSIPMVGLAQLRRAGGRNKKAPRPTMEDLAESSYLEREADTILLLHPKGPPVTTTDDVRRALLGEKRHAIEITDIIVEKNRGGRKGVVETHFDMTLGRFLPPPSAADQFTTQPTAKPEDEVPLYGGMFGEKDEDA